ncbi:MAG: GNAT superfamily N-acetyltransferase [Paracoccaceae bacterium]
MALADGYHDVPPGKVATVVTHLEMRTRAPQRPVPAPEGVSLRRVINPDLVWYRDLFNRVGGQDWMWFSRLEMTDTALAAIIGNPGVQVLSLDKDGQAQGLLELDFRTSGECELAFFGVTSPMIGTGAGRFLMNAAIALAWDHPISRFHLHTCTLDSPMALGFYRRSGFAPTRQQIEIADDPRLSGGLPKTAAPHIPIIS